MMSSCVVGWEEVRERERERTERTRGRERLTERHELILKEHHTPHEGCEPEACVCVHARVCEYMSYTHASMRTTALTTHQDTHIHNNNKKYQ